MGKRIAFVVVVFVLAAVHLAEAQPAKMHTVGRLTSGSPSDPVSVAHFDAFRQGLRDLGWTEGKNLTIEARWASGVTQIGSFPWRPNWFGCDLT